MIRKARKEAPVRKVRSNRSNLITRYPSQKMQRVIETESHTVEFAAMLQYECANSICEYYAQPMEVDQKVTSPSGKVDRLNHFPDFLLITHEGFTVEEWREEVRLLNLAMNRPDRYVREEDGWRYPLAEDYFAERGISYRLRSADELPRQYIQNLNFLQTYFEASFPALDPKEMGVLKRIFQDKASIYLRELLDSSELTSDLVYKAIADRLVVFDLYNDNLGETDRVSVYRDEPTLQFLQKSMAPVIGLPQERLDGTVQPGGRMVMDKTEYEIIFVDGDKVATICEGAERDFSLNIVERLHQLGQLKLFADPLSAHGKQIETSKLANYSPVELDAALERARWLELAVLNPDLVPCSLRTLSRYKEAKEKAGPTALDQNLALIPKHSLKGNRQRKIAGNVLDLARKVIREHYNTPQRISKSNAYLIYSGECANAPLDPCSFKTFCKEIRNLASIRMREGKRMAYQEGRFVNYLKISEEVHGVRPFQMVHIDHTELQILLCLPNSKESLGRAWLTLAMDAESRAVVGFYLTFDPPSYRSCMMVMRDIVRRHGRLPEMLVLDNGKEFHSKAMMRLCALYGVSIRYRPAAQPRFGSVMERLFGTTQSQLINQLAGNTQVLRHVRTATKQVLPENFLSWPLPGLHAALDYYFTTLYGKEPHPTHHDGPMEHLSNRLRDTGERRNRLVAYDRRFLIETCPSPVDLPTRVVDRQRGVKVNHFYYHCEEFHAPRLDGTKVEVRVDPWDIRFVYALVEDRWVRCGNNQLAKYRNYTEIELRYALEEARNRHKKKNLSPARIAEWLQVLDPRNWDDRLKKEDARQAENRLLYESLGMTSVEPMPPEPPAPDPKQAKVAPPRPSLKKQSPSEALPSNPNKTHKDSRWNQEDEYELL
jgi:putative transposase